jgi:hypothetical protein
MKTKKNESQSNEQSIKLAPELSAEQVAEQSLLAEQFAQQEQEVADAERDAVAEQMAKELGQDEIDDFDPTESIPVMTPEQEAKALQDTKDLLESAEGAEFAAVGAIDYYEEIIQEHCHDRFKIADKKKQNGVKRLTPVIQKYAPSALGLLGNYKNEIMAAMWTGSLAFGSVKQLKALRAEDDKNNPPKEQEVDNADKTAETAQEAV